MIYQKNQHSSLVETCNTEDNKAARALCIFCIKGMLYTLTLTTWRATESTTMFRETNYLGICGGDSFCDTIWRNLFPSVHLTPKEIIYPLNAENMYAVQNSHSAAAAAPSSAATDDQRPAHGSISGHNCTAAHLELSSTGRPSTSCVSAPCVANLSVG